MGSRTPFTVSVIRSLPLRAAGAYYIMPQPLHALGCFTADVATYILQPVDWLARSASLDPNFFRGYGRDAQLKRLTETPFLTKPQLFPRKDG